MKKFYLLMVSCCTFFFFSCNNSVKEPSTQFKQQWYAGKAEISSYNLQQARYGNLRQGEATLIFVTEDFSTDKLIKLDKPENENKKVRVLKMNMTKKFVTGIYPYSMMLSAFTPVSKEGKEKMLKATATSQEWCGQTYSQLRSHGRDIDFQLHSYFEEEGDQDGKISEALMEDGMWNRIRINPAGLPQGNGKMIPGLLFQRLSHNKMKAEDCVLSINNADTFLVNNIAAKVYTIHYPALQRTLKIYFSEKAPL